MRWNNIHRNAAQHWYHRHLYDSTLILSPYCWGTNSHSTSRAAYNQLPGSKCEACPQTTEWCASRVTGASSHNTGRRHFEGSFLQLLSVPHPGPTQTLEGTWLGPQVQIWLGPQRQKNSCPNSVEVAKAKIIHLAMWAKFLSEATTKKTGKVPLQRKV